MRVMRGIVALVVCGVTVSCGPTNPAPSPEKKTWSLAESVSVATSGITNPDDEGECLTKLERLLKEKDATYFFAKAGRNWDIRVPPDAVKQVRDILGTAIYKESYWAMVRSDDFPEGVDVGERLTLVARSTPDDHSSAWESDIHFTGESWRGVREVLHKAGIRTLAALQQRPKGEPEKGWSLAVRAMEVQAARELIAAVVAEKKLRVMLVAP